jgi:hypothetical protein
MSSSSSSSSSSFAKRCRHQLKTKVKTPLQRCCGMKSWRFAAVVSCALYIIVSGNFNKDSRKDVVITAILPTTARQLDFARAGLLTCGDVLTPENGIRDLIYVVPKQDIRTFEDQLPRTRVNSRIVAEDDFVPELSGRPWPGAHKQQIIKLLSYRQTSSTHILFLDSDTMCSPKWTQQRLSKQNFVRSFVTHSWFSKPRVRVCLQSTEIWFGRRQYERTALHWHIPLEYKFVMGWTPQLLSADGLKHAVEHLMSVRNVDLLGLFFKEPSYEWTEYATYFLSLKHAGLWRQYHYDEQHDLDIDGGRFGVETQIPGCLHVRVNSVDSFRRVVDEDALVPMIMLDDHKINSSDVVIVAQNFVRDH